MLSNQQTIKFILTIIIVFCSFLTRADSWIDPTWKTMLDSSDLVVLIKYTSSGSERAKAKIVSVYKGTVPVGNEIWISGFSNRYGPHDRMRKGDTYIAFLNFLPPSKSWIEDLEEEAKRKHSLRPYLDAFKNGKCYQVWSPTSGDLKVRNGVIRYDLFQTTNYRNQKQFSFNEFGSFLKAYYDDTQRPKERAKLLSKIRPVSESDSIAQYLMNLSFLGHNQFDTIFKYYAKSNNLSSRYALAILMGNIHSEQAINVLTDLLSDKNSIVQGEAVRQLKKEPSEVVAPILLKHLLTASETNYGPSNIMDPVMNTVDGGKIEIIKAMGELNYKPSIPFLLPLLETDDDYLFNIVISSLKQIGTKDYVPYINNHLENKTKQLIFTISNMIRSDSLTECIPSLKKFISTCNRNDHPTYDYTVSNCCGLGYFKSNETFDFLSNDFNKFYEYKDTLDHYKQINWIDEYLMTFTNWEDPRARPLAFKAIYDWLGYNEDFGRSPKLFEIKSAAEDSFAIAFEKLTRGKGFKLNHKICYITNTTATLSNAPPEITFLVEVKTRNNDFQSSRIELSQILNIPQYNIFLVSNDNTYFPRQNEKFDHQDFSTPLMYALDYLDKVPMETDIQFLEGILMTGVIKENYKQVIVKERIAALKERFGK